MWKQAGVIFAISYVFHQYILSQKLRPESEASFEALCRLRGYNVDTHEVITEDGFILTVFRVYKSQPTDRPVLMVHGFLGSSDDFVINHSAKPPAFRLVDAGFDTWLGNVRGSTYSQKHKTLTIENKEFWDWSAAEISRFDIKAMISYVKAYTHKEKIAYFGHSQGAVVGLALLALDPTANKDISIYASIAGTGGSFSHQPWLVTLAGSDFVTQVLEFFGIHSVMCNRSAYVSKFFAAFPYLAYRFFKQRFDIDINGDTGEHLAFYMSRYPSCTSVKSVKLRASLGNKEKTITLPDYGKEKNLIMYGSEKTSVLNFTSISTKVAVFGGKHDKIIYKEDVDHLGSILNKESLVFLKSDYELDHVGFLLSKNDRYLDDVIAIFNAHAA
jgi:pimeloyl-ACP methyl ester carboxylesterase